jgi:Flp pilus assembly protein TadD
MKTRYLLCAAAAFAVVACTKSDSTPAADTSLSLSGAATTPLDSINAAERARAAAAAAAPVPVAPATRTPVRRTYSSGRSAPVYTSGTTTTSSPTHTVKNTKRDAVIGGVAGAAIGAATGGGVKGAVIGGAAGAVIGGVIGNNVDVKKKH